MRVLLAAASAVLVLWLAVSIYCFRAAVLRRSPPDYTLPAPWYRTPMAKHRRRIAACAASLEKLPFEPMHLQSFDGLRLYGRWMPAPSPRGTVVMMHGYHSSPAVDFGCTAAFFLRELHLNLLIPDQRTHGKSEGTYITFGVRERTDCRDWAAAAAEKAPGLPVLLYGISMGAATVLMAAGEALPEAVAGIAADCGYTSPAAEFSHVLCHRMHLPVGPILFLTGWMMRRFAGFSPGEASAPEALAASRLPVLLFHGEEDTFVPPYMSLQNYAACRGERELVTVPGAAHALSGLTDEAAYRRALEDFIRRCLRQYGEKTGRPPNGSAGGSV